MSKTKYSYFKIFYLHFFYLEVSQKCNGKYSLLTERRNFEVNCRTYHSNLVTLTDLNKPKVSKWK